MNPSLPRTQDRPEGMVTTSPEEEAPRLPLQDLDTVWFQVTGTLCNLSCNHCFNESGPNNRTFDMMSIETVRETLDTARELGVREYYFTGGEPFLHPRMTDLIEETLEVGPVSVLTNGTAFTEPELDRLGELFRTSRYSLEIRVSLDGFDAESNDAIRGEGSFDAAVQGLRDLVDRGLLPIITATRTWDVQDDPEMLAGFKNLMRSVGYEHPRIKLLPSLKIGREEVRDRSYHPTEKVTHSMMKDAEVEQFLCSDARLVTERGVWACPILVLHSEARLGDTLEESLQPVSLGFDACYSCYRFGKLCSNMPATEPSGRESE